MNPSEVSLCHSEMKMTHTKDKNVCTSCDAKKCICKKGEKCLICSNPQEPEPSGHKF